MHIGFLRHATAEDDSPSGSDFDRRLTPAGWQELEHQLDLIASWGWMPSVILHSPLVRTTQTAKAVAARVHGAPLVVEDALALGSIDGILRACAPHRAPLLVGHEPTLGRLVAHLIGAPGGTLAFDKAGFARIEVDRLPTTRPARLELFLPPRARR